MWYGFEPRIKDLYLLNVLEECFLGIVLLWQTFPGVYSFRHTSTKVKVRIELTIVDLWSTALPLGYFTIYNTPSGYNLINSTIFSHGDDKSELDNRHCQASYHCLAPVGLTTCKFHGSFRIELYCKQRFCFYCHTATLTKFLCYTHISTLQGKLDCLSFLHCWLLLLTQ